MFDVVCIGNALVDITINVPDSVLAGANLKKGIMTLTDDISQKFLLSSISSMPSSLSTGGSASNVALGVAALGGKSAFIGKIGTDANGSFFESTLNARGVVPKLSNSIDLMTGSVVALITNDGERTFSTYLGASVALTKGDVLVLPKAKFFHVEAYLLENPIIKDVVFSLVEQAKKNGTKISIDLSDPQLIKRIKPTLIEFLTFADIVFANEAEAIEFTNENVLAAARTLSNFAEIAVVKLGEQGSIIISGKDQALISPEIVIPVNTNGAGDAYAAGFLLGLSKDLNLEGAGELASFLAKETVLVEAASVSKSLKAKATIFFE